MDVYHLPRTEGQAEGDIAWITLEVHEVGSLVKVLAAGRGVARSLERREPDLSIRFNKVANALEPVVRRQAYNKYSESLCGQHLSGAGLSDVLEFFTAAARASHCVPSEYTEPTHKVITLVELAVNRGLYAPGEVINIPAVTAGS